MPHHKRRSVLRGIGGTVVGGALLTGTASGKQETDGGDSRFIVDLRTVSRDEVPSRVEILHDLDAIDVLVARGDPDAVPGDRSTIPDLAIYQDGGSPGPAEEVPMKQAEQGPAWDSGAPTLTELQWDKRDQWLGDLSERPDARTVVHDVTKGEGTRVAVVDTGVYDGHPDLAGVVNEELSENFTTDPYDWRPNGAGDHGTHVAGIIAGTNADGGGVLGTAPATEIVSHRVFSGVEGATGDSLAALYAAAEKNCDVANFSVGYIHYDPEEYPYLLLIKELYERLADYAHEKGMTIVNSAGNAGLDMSSEDVMSMPTEAEGIFGVAATGPIGFLWDDTLESREDVSLKTLDDPVDSPAFYTNYGHGVDVSASGGDADLDAIADGVPGWYYDLVVSTVVAYDDDGQPYPSYGWKAGTSMSAPQVTGAYALVRALKPDADPETVEALIRDTARSAPGGELYHGAGHLDLRALVREVA